tara:strand:+ start:5413 stop:5667 length:255 start_codon:yes stop_codon:yes gene_type:complete
MKIKAGKRNKTTKKIKVRRKTNKKNRTVMKNKSKNAKKKKGGDKLCGPKLVFHHGKCESESALKLKSLRDSIPQPDPYGDPYGY